MNTVAPFNDNELLAEALSLQKAGRHFDAISIFRGLVCRHSEHAKLLYLAGTAELAANNYSESIAILEKSLAIDPNQPNTQLHLGVAFWKSQNFHKAAECYRAAINLDKNYAEAYNNLSMVMQDGFKRSEAALALVDKAITIRPDYTDAYNNRGNVLQALDRYADALASYDRSIELNPASPMAHNNRGNALRRLNRLPEALSAYEEAIRLNPDYAEAFCNMGIVLADFGQVSDARRCYQQSLTINPAFAKAHFNLAALAAGENNHKLALECLDKSIALNPEFADAHWNKSLLMLLHGKFREGFLLYEWGWKNKIRGTQRGFKQPLWLGQEPLRGKRLLIHQEQGLGDCIHYARYVLKAVEMGAEVILEAVGPLIPLLKTMKTPCHFVAFGDQLPKFDFYIPLMSLPLAFGSTLDNLGDQTPYLYSDSSRVTFWKNRLGPKVIPRVGLVWSGSTLHKNDHNRSLALKDLLPILGLPLEFHCLQKEIRDDDALCLPALPMIRSHNLAINDFSDTAALIDLMDLVISVDTSVAHAAGAMRKPTWILLPAAPDWRWLLDREDSPWYSSVRLFRQSVQGQWSDVIGKLRTALELKFLKTEKPN